MDTFDKILEILIHLEQVAALALTIGGLWIVLFRVLARLGAGLQTRRISIIADTMDYATLKQEMKDTGIFQEHNIRRLDLKKLIKEPNASEAINAELADESLLVFVYNAPEKPRPQPGGKEVEEDPKKAAVRKAQEDLLHRVLDGKQKTAGLIVYAQTNMERDMFNTTGDAPNTVIVNARGRLLNDLLNLMMTTKHLREKDPLSALLGR